MWISVFIADIAHAFLQHKGCVFAMCGTFVFAVLQGGTQVDRDALGAKLWYEHPGAAAQGVVNRDIKLENTLLDASPKPLVKITDFGYCKSDKESLPKSKVGTPGYTGALPMFCVHPTFPLPVGPVQVACIAPSLPYDQQLLCSGMLEAGVVLARHYLSQAGLLGTAHAKVAVTRC